ncbi:DUF3363 domain-containing protein [uncultured Hyphomonas sp.]|uniref:DUF3363 domain-containing protein n=1 Tax=uncultured Hyphomonas sp. TaxID=225298 RepID=UPI0030D7147C|tara:strand:- start:22454 stop:24349 length:1896 start_codon:yes stop_codon:yes gene_type:complete
MTDRSEYAFRPRLGRIRSLGNAKRGRTFTSRLARAISRAGPKGRAGPRRRQRRPRIQGGRRVVVKARVVRMAGSTRAALAKHLRYISRESAMRDGEEGHVFDHASEDVDRADFATRAEDDRHHFRFIVSPEDGSEMADLKPLVRDLMSQMETDLGTRLEWVGAVHHNTAQPHAHIVLRGRRDDGRDLVLPRAYISHQIRETAEDLATRELGPETRLEQDLKLARETRAERLTKIDRSLRKLAGRDGRLTLTDTPPRYRQVNHARLKRLQQMGLADFEGGGTWRLDERLETRLRTLGERGDIIKALNRAARNSPGRRIDPDTRLAPGARLTGQIARLSAGGDFHDETLAAIDTPDGRLISARLGANVDMLHLKPGMLVTVSRKSGTARPSDRTIKTVAHANGGIYSASLHQAHDPRATPDFVSAHVRRLEVMRRLGLAERRADASWTVPDDYLERVAAIETEKAGAVPLSVQIDSHLTLAQQVKAEGLTWLDEQPETGWAHGFGADLTAARRQRWQVLQARGLAEAGQQSLSAEQSEMLKQRGMEHTGKTVADSIGKPYRALPKSGTVEGVYTATVTNGQGRHAVIEQKASFTLAPYRAVMERSRGMSISGTIKNGRVNWIFGKRRTRGLSR